MALLFLAYLVALTALFLGMRKVAIGLVLAAIVLSLVVFLSHLTSVLNLNF